MNTYMKCSAMHKSLDFSALDKINSMVHRGYMGNTATNDKFCCCISHIATVHHKKPIHVEIYSVSCNSRECLKATYSLGLDSRFKVNINQVTSLTLCQGMRLANQVTKAYQNKTHHL